MNDIGKFPYEEAAEHKTGIEGWVCKTCRRFWGDNEHMAKWCCAGDLKCETKDCAARVKKHSYMYCDQCLSKRDVARWLKLEEVAWDGKSPLVLDDDDKYFFNVEDLDEYLEEHKLSVEDVRLVIAVPDSPPWFEMSEFLSDYLSEDSDRLGFEKIDKLVNKWIEKNAPKMWVPGKTRPSVASISPYLTASK